MKTRRLKAGERIRKGDQVYTTNCMDDYFLTDVNKSLIGKTVKDKMIVYREQKPITDKQRIDFVQRNNITVEFEGHGFACVSDINTTISTGSTWRKAVDKAMKEFKK